MEVEDTTVRRAFSCSSGMESAPQLHMVELSHGSGKPTCFLLRTTKGLGVSYMENAVDWHGKACLLQIRL